MMSSVSTLPKYRTRKWTSRSRSAGPEDSACTSCVAWWTASNTSTRMSNGEAASGFARTWGRNRTPGNGGAGRRLGMLTIDSKGAGLLVMAGRLDASQCGPAQAALDKVDGVVTLDCTKLEYISS